MQRLTRRSVIAISIVTALGLSACGGDDDSTTDPDPAPTTSPATDDGADDATDDGADDATDDGADDATDDGNDDATTGPADEPAEAGEVDEMVWAVSSPIESMDVAVWSDAQTLRAQTAAFDRVLALDNDGQPQPWIASAFETPDPLTMVLTIRDDVTFWDGSPMTAEDVAYSIARHVGPDSTSGNAFIFATVASVEVTDPTTVTINLAVPDPSLAGKLSIWAQVRQQAYDEAAGDAAGGPDQPGMGTGPYSITSYSSADGVVLTRNDDYWAGAPKVRQIEFTSIADPETARLAMSSGEIDGFFDVPLIATRQWDQLENATMTYVEGPFLGYLSMDTSRAPFDDVNARTAIAHLIDREGLLGPLFNGRAAVGRSVVPGFQVVETFGEADADAIYTAIGAVPEFSIDLAREALAASNTPDGFTVDLPVDTTQPWMALLAQHLAANAEQIGITVNVMPVSFADWGAGLTDPEGSPLQLVSLVGLSTWAGEFPPVTLGSTAFFGTARYGSEEIDALVAEIAAAATVEDLRQPLEDLMTMAIADLPYLPLFDEQSATALSNDFVWEGGYTYYAVSQAWPLQLGGAG